MLHFPSFCASFIPLMNIISNFVVFEGGDGSGTSTQLSLLKERLSAAGKPVFFPAFEPTDGQIGKLLRAALKKEIAMQPETMAMLFAADRNEHLCGQDGILAHAALGELVICDRYVLSSLVYQGIECGDELPQILNSRFPAPETLFFFDIDPETAIGRLRGRASLEIYEYREFQVKVREKYLSLLEMYRGAGVRVETIDASKSVREIAEQVWSVLAQMPIMKKRENTP
jgi:dTMP kinase